MLEKALELKEKIKFTFDGFNISKKPIPKELMRRSKDILESKLLDLLAKSYLVTQIYSLYDTTNENYAEVAEKAVKHRTPEEQHMYRAVSLLMEKVFKFKEVLIKSLDKGEKEKIKAIKKIKLPEENRSKETDSPEYRMYKLLVHLCPKKENYFISAFFKTIHYQASPLGLEPLSPSSLSLKR